MSIRDGYKVLHELHAAIEISDGTWLMRGQAAQELRIIDDDDCAPAYLIEPWQDPTPIYNGEDMDKALIGDLSPEMAIVLDASDRFKEYMMDSEFMSSDAFDPSELFDLAVEYGREDAVEDLIPHVGADTLADGLRVAADNGYTHNEVMDLLLPLVPPSLMQPAITACVENGDTERADYIRRFVADRDQKAITAGLTKDDQPHEQQPRKARRM